MAVVEVVIVIVVRMSSRMNTIKLDKMFTRSCTMALSSGVTEIGLEITDALRAFRKVLVKKWMYMRRAEEGRDETDVNNFSTETSFVSPIKSGFETVNSG